MKDVNGTIIKIGDEFQLWEGCTGKVVCSIEDSIYTAEYTEEDWSYLEFGILIDTDSAGLLHYTEPEDGFKRLSRKT